MYVQGSSYQYLFWAIMDNRKKYSVNIRPLVTEHKPVPSKYDFVLWCGYLSTMFEQHMLTFLMTPVKFVIGKTRLDWWHNSHRNYNTIIITAVPITQWLSKIDANRMAMYCLDWLSGWLVSALSLFLCCLGTRSNRCV